MTTDYKVTELFCIIDEFCKHFDAENAGNLLEDNSGTKRRRRQASLSDSEIMTILLYFHFGTFRNFKHYYLFFIKGTMKSYFAILTGYLYSSSLFIMVEETFVWVTSSSCSESKRMSEVFEQAAKISTGNVTNIFLNS